MANPPFPADQSLFSAVPSSASHASQTSSLSQPQPLTLTLPAAYHDNDNVLQTIDLPGSLTFKKFLQWDLDVSRLNKVHKHLWMAGLPVCARPLYQQIMIGREIIITERADLHLVWHDSRLFLKPLPEYLMEYTIWKEIFCQDRTLYEEANGFLLSYMWLVCHKSDLKIAHDNGF